MVANQRDASEMRIEIDPASAQAFMATSLEVERNGMPLTMGSALAALDIDPWSLAGELAIAPQSRAAARLEALLGKLEGGVPGARMIAREAVAALPSPSVEEADFATIMRLALRNSEFTGALVCVLVLTALAILLLEYAVTGDLLPVLGGYFLVGLTWLHLWRRYLYVLASLFSVASGIIGAISALVRLSI
jgi:hypothetical protein